MQLIALMLSQTKAGLRWLASRSARGSLYKRECPRAHALMRGYDLDAKAIPDLAIDSVCIHGGHRSGQNTGRHRVRSGRLRLRRRTSRAGPACLRHACCSCSKLGHCVGLGHADGAGSGRWW